MDITATVSGKQLAAAMKEADFKALGFSLEKNFDFTQAKQGIWVVSEAAEQAQELLSKEDTIEQKILGMILKKGLNERVEGVFEKELSKEELEKFSQMLKQGKVIRFKLNPGYKKAVYKLPQDLTKKKPVSKELVDMENIEDYSLEKNGFLVVRNEERARKLSEALTQRIKNGEIKGIKSFDGNFYVIEAEVLEALKEKVCSVLAEKKNCSTQEIAKAIGTGNTPVKIAAEFLKEDGIIFEKKKENLCYIE